MGRVGVLVEAIEAFRRGEVKDLSHHPQGAMVELELWQLVINNPATTTVPNHRGRGLRSFLHPAPGRGGEALYLSLHNPPSYSQFW